MMARWRGLKALVQDGVLHGSRAIERVQKGAAARPFAVLEVIPPIADVARTVHGLYDLGVSGVHGGIRLVARVVGGALDVVLDAVDPGAR